MTFAEAPTALKEFRRIPWKFQQTFKTPLKKLPQFVAAIVATDQAFQTASVTIEQAVFEPRHWIDLMTQYSLPPRYEKGVSVTAAGQQEIEAVLAQF